MKAHQNNFTNVYNKYSGSKAKITKKLNITDTTFYTYKSKYINKAVVPIEGKIQVKINTTLHPQAITNLITDMQKSGNKVTLIIE